MVVAVVVIVSLLVLAFAGYVGIRFQRSVAYNAHATAKLGELKAKVSEFKATVREREQAAAAHDVELSEAKEALQRERQQNRVLKRDRRRLATANSELKPRVEQLAHDRRKLATANSQLKERIRAVSSQRDEFSEELGRLRGRVASSVVFDPPATPLRARLRRPGRPGRKSRADQAPGGADQAPRRGDRTPG